MRLNRLGRLLSYAAAVTLGLFPVSAARVAAGTISDEGWWPDYGYSGADGEVERLIVHDGRLVVAGGFRTIDGQSAESPAEWNGVSWSSIRGSRSPVIHGFTSWQGRLVAWGVFGGIPGTHVAVWNGIDWQPLGAHPINPVYQWPENRSVYSDGTRLVAQTGEGALEWTGAEWKRLPPIGNGGITLFRGLPVVMEVKQSREGIFASVSILQDETWRPLGPDWGWNNWPVGLFPVQQDLYLATRRLTTGDSSNRAIVYRWDGERWAPVGSELPGFVSHIFEHEGSPHLILGLNPESYDGGPCQIMSWRENEWAPAGEVVGRGIRCVGVHGDRIVAGGSFSLAGRRGVSGLAVLDESGWTGLQQNPGSRGWGVDGDVRAISAFRDQMAVAGGFASAAGGVCPGIALEGAQDWRAPGEGVDNSVFALAEFNGDLIAGGDFLEAGGTAAARVARWDGLSWSALGDGFDDRVLAFQVYHGDLYAGGWFGNSGSTPCAHIARWAGAQWQPVAGGVDGRVRALAVFNDLLVVGGEFREVSGNPVRYLAMYDGHSWSSWRDHPSGPVFALTVWNSRLVVGGMFRMIGRQYAGGLALWDGHYWTSPGSVGTLHGSYETPGWVHSLCVYRDNLVVGGWFNRAGGRPNSASNWIPAANVAFWNGQWSAPATGTDGPVHAVAQVTGSLFIGGRFRTAGGRPSWNLARWDETLVSGPAVEAAAAREGPSAVITWKRGGPTNNRGYEVHRESYGEPRRRLGHAVESGDRFSFEDPDPPSAAADYWLRELGPFGTEGWQGPIHLGALPAGISVGMPSPNPFRGRTSFQLSLSSTTRVTVGIHDVQGRHLATLVDGTMVAGVYTLNWDGLTTAGRRASSGLYWIRTRTAHGLVSRRVILR